MRHPVRIMSSLVAAIVLLACLAAAQNGRIAFTSNRSGSWQIYTMNPDGSDQFQVTNLASNDDDGIFPSISPDGKRIAFTYNAGDGPDLYVVNVDGSGLHAITEDHLSLIPRWSPNGKRIVFTAISQSGTGVIARISDNGGDKNVLTPDIWESVGGMYTPDGKQIVFGSQMGGLVSAVWIMNADGSHKRRLTNAALKGQPWGVSPDGKQIVGYTNQDSPAALPGNVFIMSLDGSDRRRLAKLSKLHHDIFPTFSPEGSKISFMSDRFSTDIDEFHTGTFDVLTMNTDGTEISDPASGVGHCPNDGNCVTPFWGASPQK